MVGIALEPYNFAQLVAPDLGSFATGDGREGGGRRLAQVSIKLLLIIPETQRVGKVLFSLSQQIGWSLDRRICSPRNK